MHLSEIWHSKKNDCRLSRTQVNRYATFLVSRAGPAHYAEPRQSSFFGFFRLQIYVFLHYAILGKMENMGKKL